MSNHDQQADGEIHENQLRNFLVNTLEEEVSLSLGNNLPHENTVLYHLREKNVWRYLHWEYVATPRPGGRRYWKWSFAVAVADSVPNFVRY